MNFHFNCTFTRHRASTVWVRMTRHIAAALMALFACTEARSQPTDQPPTFEVASIKPSPPRKPGEPQGRVGCFRAPGSRTRFVCARASISTIVLYAYDLKPYQLRPPVATDTSEFNIEAKLPSGTTEEQLPVMLTNLLSDRFKLTFHRENAEVKGYALTVAKGGSKIKESISVARTTEDVKPASPVRDADGFVYIPGLRNTLVVGRANGLTRWVGTNVAVDSEVRNAPRLTTLLYSLTGLPVIDATALKGKYDFTLTFASDNMGATEDTTSPPTDVGPTVFKALEEQLGLKLEPRKIAVNLFVIDHVEKTPGEN
jgi:uncharacterized protein (TIGR03435 family)